MTIPMPSGPSNIAANWGTGCEDKVVLAKIFAGNALRLVPV